MSEFVEGLSGSHRESGAARPSVYPLPAGGFSDEAGVLGYFQNMPARYPALFPSEFRTALDAVRKVPLTARAFFALLETEVMEQEKRTGQLRCAEAIQAFAGQITDEQGRMLAATFVTSGSFIQSLHRNGPTEPHKFLIGLASQFDDEKSRELARVEPSKQGNGVFFVFPKDPVNLNPFMMIIGRAGTVDYIVPSYGLRDQLAPEAFMEFCNVYAGIYKKPVPPFFQPMPHAASPRRV